MFLFRLKIRCRTWRLWIPCLWGKNLEIGLQRNWSFLAQIFPVSGSWRTWISVMMPVVPTRFLFHSWILKLETNSANIVLRFCISHIFIMSQQWRLMVICVSIIWLVSNKNKSTWKNSNRLDLTKHRLSSTYPDDTFFSFHRLKKSLSAFILHCIYNMILKREIVLRRRRVRAEKEAELERSRRARKLREQLEAAKSKSAFISHWLHSNGTNDLLPWLKLSTYQDI